MAFLFLFLVLESGVLIVFWKFYEKIQRKNLRRIVVLKNMKFSDFFLGIFLRNRIFLPRYSAKESCKKLLNCAPWAKIIKLGKKCISVCAIIRMNGNHFLPSSMKYTSFLSEKWKIISTKFLLLYDLIHIHIKSFLYLQIYIIIWNILLSGKKYIIIWNFFLF